MKDQELFTLPTLSMQVIVQNCTYNYLQSLALKQRASLYVLAAHRAPGPQSECSQRTGVISQQCQKLKPLTADEVQLRQT